MYVQLGANLDNSGREEKKRPGQFCLSLGYNDHNDKTVERTKI